MKRGNTTQQSGVKQNSIFLIPLGLFLVVTGLTGSLMVGAHIIAASAATPVVDSQAMGAAGALYKLVGPGLLLAGIAGIIGTITYVTVHPEGKSLPEKVRDIFESNPNDKEIAAAKKKCQIGLIASTTAIFTGLGFIIVGAIEPIAANVVEDLTIATGFFAALAFAMIVLDGYINHDPSQWTIREQGKNEQRFSQDLGRDG